VITYPNAKINIGLNVVGKRPDGFHDIETVFFPIPLSDILEIIPSAFGTTTITTSGLPIPGQPYQNICIKAIELLRTSNPILHSSLFTLHLHKQIPAGSGLGGGSSDGAFTLKMLNAMEGPGLSEEHIVQLASQLGSDCAFFVRNRPAFATGRGEKLEEISLSLKGYFLALVIPPVHVGTAEAYSMITPGKPSLSVKEIVALPLSEWKNLLRNDFEEPVTAKYPEIKDVKEKLYERGAVYASMSGSGSAVYGLFKDPPKIAGHFPANYFSQTAQL
jgi:4-diphosphocytidyl-2-C-methyl-D-erythritol kinase